VPQPDRGIQIRRPGPKGKPVHLCGHLREDTQNPRLSLTPGEARQLLTAARSERNAARWSVALSLGMRQGESLGLLWSDVDLDAGTLHVAEQLRRQVWRHGCGEPTPATDPLAKPS
jgi:integrase